MTIMFKMAALLGTNPVSMLVLGIIAIVCAQVLRNMNEAPMAGIAYFVLLFASGLGFDDVAVGLGFYDAFDVRLDVDQGWNANWALISEGLPNVLLSGTIGMCFTGLIIVLVTRFLQPQD